MHTHAFHTCAMHTHAFHTYAMHTHAFHTYAMHTHDTPTPHGTTHTRVASTACLLSLLQFMCGAHPVPQPLT